MTKPKAKSDQHLPPLKRLTARQAAWRCTLDAYDFQYTDHDADKLDVVKPGFFNLHRSELIVGSMIEIRVGHPVDGILRGFVQVISTSDRDETVDVEVSTGEWRKFTPVRHTGTLEDEKERKVA